MLWPLFAATLTIRVAVIVYAGLAIALGAAASASGKKIPLASTALVASVVVALASGWIVFRLHWFGFVTAEWTTTGLYITALLTGLLWALNGLARACAALLAVAMVAATLVVPAPKGGEAHYWSVVVTVQNEHGDPLKEAMVSCAVAKDAITANSQLTYPYDELVRTFPTAVPVFTDDKGRTPPFEFGDEEGPKPTLCGGAFDYFYTDADGRTQETYARALSGTLLPHEGTNKVGLTIDLSEHKDWHHAETRWWPGSYAANEGLPAQRPFLLRDL